MKTHPFPGQILAGRQSIVKEKMKKVKNSNSMDILRKWKRENSTEGRVAGGRICNKEVKKDTDGLKLERIVYPLRSFGQTLTIA